MPDFHTNPERYVKVRNIGWWKMADELLAGLHCLEGLPLTSASNSFGDYWLSFKGLQKWFIQE